MIDFQKFSCTRSWSPHGTNADFHLHDHFELYFFISGDVDYFVERVKYHLSFGDVLIFNSTELHKPTFRSQTPYERIILNFDAAFAAQFSPPDLDLTACFTQRRRGEGNLIRMNTTHTRELFDLLRKLSTLQKKQDTGSDAVRLAAFLEILVLVGRAFQNRETETAAADSHPLSGMMEYIDQNLTADLGLDTLAAQFFLSKTYLCRLFKKYTGATIHSYILGKRVSKAKRLLLAGESVTAACHGAGFNDYANFIRAFKRITGLPPGVFKKEGEMVANGGNTW